jgi:hypothetical protein
MAFPLLPIMQFLVESSEHIWPVMAILKLLEITANPPVVSTGFDSSLVMDKSFAPRFAFVEHLAEMSPMLLWLLLDTS